MTRHAEIAGAGFAGLAAATALAQKGWSVRLHERGEKLRSLGAGIFMWRNSLEILKELGLYDSLRPQCHRPPFYETSIHDVSVSKETFGGVEYLTMTRADLHGVLVAGAHAAGVEILTDSHVVGATRDGEIKLESGEIYSADLVIGADGVHSKVRDSMDFKYEKWGSRDGIARVLIPRDKEYIGGDWDNVIDMWNFAPRMMRILYVPCNEDELYLGLMAPNEDEEAAKIPIDLAVWADMFPRMRTALEHVAKLAEARRDTYETRVLDAWVDGAVALVGDSAHAMCPALAQGAGCGMVNAFTLAERVSEPGVSVSEALKSWEAEFRGLTDRCQDRSKYMMETRSMSRGNQFSEEILETAAFDPIVYFEQGVNK